MSPSTQEMLAENVKNVSDMLVEIWEAIDNEEEYQDSDPNDYLSELPLEVVDERGKDFAVILGTGGPHIELTASGFGNVELVGYWSGSVYRLSDSEGVFERTLEYFIER